VPKLVVDDIMTPSPVTVAQGSPLDEADKLLREHHVRHLVVVDDEGFLAGVLSDRDLRAASASELTWRQSSKQERFLHAYRVRDVARMRPLRVVRGSSIRAAAQLMRRTRVGCLPVTEGGRPVGIITGRDFLDLLLELIDATTPAGAVPTDEHDEEHEPRSPG